MSNPAVDITKLLTAPPEDVEVMVQQLSALLPTQGPIKDFIHHNTLHSFQDLPFGEGIAEASHIYGADLSSLVAAPNLKGQCFDGLAETGIRRRRASQLGYQPDHDLLPQMIRLVAAYFDQGLAIWTHPVGNFAELGLWRATAQLVQSSLLPLVPLNRHTCQKLLALDSCTAVDQALNLLTRSELRRQYVTEVFLTLPGWAGFVHSCQTAPELLTQRRKSSLMEWLALFLTIEVGLLERKSPRALSAKNREAQLGWNITDDDRSSRLELGRHIETVLREREWSAYSPILKSAREAKRTIPNVQPTVQVITCIDDREFSLRAFLEKEAPFVETFGAPGFFGVDCFIQEGTAGDLVKHCPVPVQPRHILRVTRSGKDNGKVKANVASMEKESTSLVRGWLTTQMLGLPAGLKLLTAVVSPRLVEDRRLDQSRQPVSLDVIVDDPVCDTHGRQFGYTVKESAHRVANLLRSIGQTKRFAPLVCIVGHGSSSVNNPYFAAYDCGACSGRPGNLNALAFCTMANDPRVRVELQTVGIDIPDGSTFVPFIHDTSADRLELVCEPRLNADNANRLADFMACAESALAQNAKYRTRQFDLAGSTLSDLKAHAHVQTRSVAWYEPRPEYNHATNIGCIVGRRHLSTGITSDRAIFLQSYDPESDTDGALLVGILGAVIPVCGGINLEYFFSRIDTQKYGAGSKLPQNVSGLVGVMTGLESDLRTGLPAQMTEIHDPLRLLIVVEQSPWVILRAMEKLPHLRNWVDNHWVWLVSQDPLTGEQKINVDGAFTDWERKNV